MFGQTMKRDKDFKYSKNLFPMPTPMLINELALHLYNKVSDGNQGLSADWFEFYIDLYKIEEVEYMAEALHIIRSTISNFDDELEEIKKKGNIINNSIDDILKAKGM